MINTLHSLKRQALPLSLEARQGGCRLPNPAQTANGESISLWHRIALQDADRVGMQQQAPWIVAGKAKEKAGICSPSGVSGTAISGSDHGPSIFRWRQELHA